MARWKKISIAILAVVLVVTGCFSLDFILTNGRIYQGVRVGSVDVSGLTEQEAYAALTKAYSDQLKKASVVLYTEEADMGTIDTSVLVNNGISEYTSHTLIPLADALEDQTVWVVNDENDDYELPIQELVQEAFAVGREDGGLFARLNAFFVGEDIPAVLTFDEGYLESLSESIESTLDNAGSDYRVEIKDGVASIVEGKDGLRVNRYELEAALNDMLLSEPLGEYLVNIEYRPSFTTLDQAESVADYLNRLFTHQVAFTYEGNPLSVSEDCLATWMLTTVKEEGDGYAVGFELDEDDVRRDLMYACSNVIDRTDSRLTLRNEDDVITVSTDGNLKIPDFDQVMADLDDLIYNDALVAMADEDDDAIYGETEAMEVIPEESADPLIIDIQTTYAPTTMTFDEALAAGVFDRISRYTTTYTDNSGDANRNNNIHLAAELLNNSIVSGNGGSWSFNEVAGERTPEKGFLGAGVILDNEYTDAIGGGICQVATTVFNAVYEAGFPVLERHNHSLRTSKYPEGRDAAVSYPDLDLVWENDSTSDVILRCSYTSTSVTAALYGISPGYTVKTELGEWTIDKDYKTIEEIDEALAPGKTKVKRPGQEGQSFYVVRTVMSRSGEVLRTNTFRSYYPVVDKIVIKGPESAAEKEDKTSSTSNSSSSSSAATSSSQSSSSEDDLSSSA